jgi:DNA-binding MarR family transcriptional regulator
MNVAKATASATADIRRGVTRLARRMRAERPLGALSGNKIGVLSYLHREGEASPTDIALAEHQQPQSLTRVFAELELAGLLRRRKNPNDGRQSILELTESGREALRSDMLSRDRWLAEALESLTETERQVLALSAAIMNRLAESPSADAQLAQPRPESLALG